MDLATITPTNFRERFFRDFRDFPYVDQDITNAFAEAQVAFNQSLFDTDAEIKLGYLYLTAHFMVNDLRAAAGGVTGTGSLPVTARSVGSVSETYEIPEKYLKNPVFAFYTQSPYGLKYLAMILPKLVGNMQAVWGGANP